jgi:cell division septation protein DedD
MSAKNVKPSGHSAVVPEKEKRPVQVAFLIPVDKERIPRGGSAPPMGRGPVKSERAQGRAPDGKTGISKAENAVIQVGAFRVRATAEQLIRQLREKGYDPYLEIQTLQDLGLIHRVRLSGYGSVAGARTAMVRLQDQGFDDVFVVSLKTHRPL